MIKDIIRVLIVEDSPLMVKVLTNVLNADSQLMVVGVAYNGKEAVDLVPSLKPDIITMDIHMPVMDGFEATKHIMAYNPTPILIISTSVFKQGMDKVFKAISLGALDVVDKSLFELKEKESSIDDFIENIKLLSKIKVIHHPLAKIEKKQVKQLGYLSKDEVGERILTIAASTGGPQALFEVLKTLPADFPCGIAIVQHITAGFVDGLAGWLDSECAISVKVAEDSEEIQPATAYIAPCNLQMRIEKDKRIHLYREGPQGGHIPCADILFESAGNAYGKNAIGIILTGMGKDGAKGIKSLHDTGGLTIAQDEESSIIFGMPKAAIEMNAIDKIVSLSDIPSVIMELLKCHR
ncbi:MAG: chemotaxis-specific protein-glutamate methyltransferase CheB [Candidatus Omnitrophota bacterium]